MMSKLFAVPLSFFFILAAASSSSAALAGMARPSGKSDIGNSVREAIAGVYSSVSPAQRSMIGAFLNSPTQPDALTFRVNLLRAGNLPQRTAAADPAELAANEPFVLNAQSTDLTEDQLATIAARIHSLHTVLHSRRIIPEDKLAALQGASTTIEAHLTDINRVKVLLKVAKIAQALYPPEEASQPVVSDVPQAGQIIPKDLQAEGIAKHEDKGVLDIVDAQKSDSLNSDSWRNYLEATSLSAAWLPPAASPYRRFAKTATIHSVSRLGDKMTPRYGSGERNSQEGVRHLINSGHVGKNTAIILDSAGPFNIAMAVDLIENGYQPVLMMDNPIHNDLSPKSVNDLASLLYFAEHLHRLRVAGRIVANAPPVFILSEDMSAFASSPPFALKDPRSGTHVFPTAAELKAQGITKIIYLNQADVNGEFDPSLQSLDRMGLNKELQNAAVLWQRAGIQLLFTGVEPHPRTYRRGFD